MLDSTYQRSTRYYLWEADSFKTNLPNNKFTKIILRNSFHHIDYPQNFLIDLAQKLRQDGEVFIVERFKERRTDHLCTLLYEKSIFLNIMEDSPLSLKEEIKIPGTDYSFFRFRLKQ